MTLAQLRYLIAIVDAGLNITEAAVAVNATQSGLSQQLKLLEEELGFQIFVRRGRKLDRLSDSGVGVIESARLILAEAGNIDAMAANQRGETEGDLRIFTTQTQAQYVLPDALAALRARYPSVRVQLDLSGDLAGRDLADAPFDLAVVSAPWAQFPNCTAIPLYRWSWRLLLPASHGLAAQERIHMDELARHPLIGFESSARRDGPIVRTFVRAGFTARLAYSASDSEVIKAYVRSGLGLGLVPEMAAQGLGQDIVARHIDERFPTSIAWAVLPLDRVTRDYLFELLGQLAPRFSLLEIRQLVQFGGEFSLDDIPKWKTGNSIRRPKLAI